MSEEQESSVMDRLRGGATSQALMTTINKKFGGGGLWVYQAFNDSREFLRGVIANDGYGNSSELDASSQASVITTVEEQGDGGKTSSKCWWKACGAQCEKQTIIAWSWLTSFAGGAESEPAIQNHK